MVDIYTHTYPAIYHNPAIRTVLSLEKNKWYYNTLRIYGLNAGVEDTQNTDASWYNFVGGVIPTINRISLQSNGIDVDANNDVPNIGVFKNCLRDNRSEKNMRHILTLSQLGFTTSQYNGRTISKSKFINDYALGTNSDTSGYIELKTLLPFLDSNELFMFPNGLDIIIEWNSNIRQVVAGPKDGNLTPLNYAAPILIADEERRPERQKWGSTVYQSWESDRLSFEALAAPVAPATTVEAATKRYKISGFDKKKCGKGFIQVQMTDANNNLIGNTGSLFCMNERYNLILDSQGLFPSPETQLTKRSRLDELWGGLDLPLNVQLPNLDATLTSGANNKVNLLADGVLQNLSQMLSWGAVDLTGKTWKTLEVLYNRTATASANSRLAITFRLHMLVYKSLSFDSDGNPVISYA